MITFNSEIFSIIIAHNLYLPMVLSKIFDPIIPIGDFFLKPVGISGKVFSNSCQFC